ncbi:hypothetical protein e1012e08.tmp0341 [Eimeria tenella]|uniref:Uncharacterized protein n=1 Tax=Eimeria tenella TaxID=5802 RepID=C8TDN1_EIMTE|nr:hypothetical protein e1012e08.tmp0341 [Eimeria tenella]
MQKEHARSRTQKVMTHHSKEKRLGNWLSCSELLARFSTSTYAGSCRIIPRQFWHATPALSRTELVPKTNSEAMWTKNSSCGSFPLFAIKTIHAKIASASTTMTLLEMLSLYVYAAALVTTMIVERCENTALAPMQ